MTIRRTESTLGRDLRKLGIACVSTLGIVLMADAQNGFAITKPESIPQDTGTSGTQVTEASETTQTTSTRPIQDKPLLTPQDYANND